MTIEQTIKNQSVLQFVIDLTKRLLGSEQINKEDDFFAKGGDSLMAIDLLASIQQEYKIKLELTILFEQRILLKIANIIAAKIDLATQ